MPETRGGKEVYAEVTARTIVTIVGVGSKGIGGAMDQRDEDSTYRDLGMLQR